MPNLVVKYAAILLCAIVLATGYAPVAWADETSEPLAAAPLAVDESPEGQENGAPGLVAAPEEVPSCPEVDDPPDASADAVLPGTAEASVETATSAEATAPASSDDESLAGAPTANVSKAPAEALPVADTPDAAVNSSQLGNAKSAAADEQEPAREETAGTETTNTPADAGAGSDTRSSADELPAQYDARSTGVISAVRLQDPWGACWAFGSLAAMEANLVKQGLLAPGSHLSPRHLIYFAGTPVGQEAGAQAGEGQHASDILVSLYGNNAVFEMGGHALEVASAISTGEGVVLESAFPYRNDEAYVSASGEHYATDGTWSLDESARYSASYGLREMLRFPKVGTFVATDDMATYALDYYTLEAVKQAIADYGAVSVSYRSYRNADFASHYDAENATFFTNTSTLIDHDVCIVGWDDSFPREKFTTGADSILPEGDGAWIVKNSWGAASNAFPNYGAFGKDGYCYISYYDRSTQGFTAWDMMSLASSEATAITNQYDYMGQRSNAETRVVDYNPTSYANVFTADVNQAVRAVSVNTYAPNTEVAIQVYALPAATGVGAVDPTQGTLLATKDLTVDWSGYHRIQLDMPALVKAGQRFAVVVSMVESDKNGNKTAVASIEAGNNAASMETYGLTHYDTVIVNFGETSVLVDHDENPATPPIWMDGTEYAALIQNRARDAAYYGNANIKAFADPYNDPDPGPAPEPAPPAPSPQPAPAPNPQPAPAPGPSPAPSPSPNVQPEEGKTLQPPVPSIGAKVAAAATTPYTGDAAHLVVLGLLFLAVLSFIGGFAAFRNRS